MILVRGAILPFPRIDFFSGELFCHPGELFCGGAILPSRGAILLHRTWQSKRYVFNYWVGVFLTARRFVLICNIGQQWHSVCCYDSSYAGYPAIFVSAPKERGRKVPKSENTLKMYFSKKKVCILLHKMILHMQKWGGSSLYPILKSQTVEAPEPYQNFLYAPLL